MKRPSRSEIRMSRQDPRLKSLKQFGGSLLLKSHAKVARPLSTKHLIHVVLKSSLATGEFSLRSLKNQKIVQRIVLRQAQKYGIKICEFANAGNHLHLLLKLGHRKAFKPFIRAVTGSIALQVSGANKNQNLRKILKNLSKDSKKKFWDFRPWTRIIEASKTYSVAQDLIIQSYLEKIGMIAHRSREYLKYFREAPA